jgi:hypothetical protein
MICSAKPVLTEDLCVGQKEEFSITCYMCEMYEMCERPSIFTRDKPIFSSERMLHKDNYRKGSVEKKISGCESQGACHQEELIGGKL